MKVLKFGGSSVANATNMRAVAEIVIAAAASDRIVVVLSAMQGATDTLIAAAQASRDGDAEYSKLVFQLGLEHTECARELIQDPGSYNVITEFIDSSMTELTDLLDGVRLLGELTDRTLDRLLSYGELMSTRIFAAALTNTGIGCQWADSRELIRTDDHFGNAAVNFPATERLIVEHVNASSAAITVMPGFIASDENGNVTTLGRGGSDYTAAIAASALNADVLEIWTDVSGMMTADPRFIRNARHIPRISYREAMELSHFGAKVIYPPTIHPVMAKGIPVWIKNTFDPQAAGTLIESETADDRSIIRGISNIDRIAMLSLEGSGMVGVPGFSKRLFEALSRAQINVILITQSSSEHSISVAVEDRYSDLAKRVVDLEFENEISVGKIDQLKVEAGLSILALVGDNMRSHTGVSGRMFATLGHNGINIHAIAQGSSERNISAVIGSTDVRKAVNVLHEEFFSDGNKQINVFIAGVGTVGSRLIGQIAQQHQHIMDGLRLNLRVVGIANSKQAVIAEEGVSLADFGEQLANAPAMMIGEFTDAVIEQNLRNAVFVDITASPEVVETYPKLLEKSVSVIACNKVAASGEFETYRRLKDLAREYNAKFYFETNVGAGLPVIHTLNDLINSGDRVTRIEAVLSGTLNFVFNNYDGTRPFAEVVKQAQTEGYTEPDPRLDLNGTDVARKILILAREAGNRLEMDDITNNGFLPASCLAGSVDDFYAEMERHEDHFRSLFDNAAAMGLTLKYIASFDDGKASVGLESIGPDHNFANLSGKDNAVLFYTDRYSEQPLVIKGAGAGADVTAAGVFADIIRAARN